MQVGVLLWMCVSTRMRVAGQLKLRCRAILRRVETLSTITSREYRTTRQPKSLRLEVLEAEPPSRLTLLYGPAALHRGPGCTSTRNRSSAIDIDRRLAV